MTTWHDISDQLTPAQAAQLARYGDGKPDALLAIARGMAVENTAATVLSDLPIPDGAVSVDDWKCWHDDIWSRHFTGSVRCVGPATITIHGQQFSDGHCERCLYDGTNELTSAQARELASALQDAANEMNAL